MPDIFVPMDTSFHYQYINKLRRKSIIYNFVLDYTDKNRQEIKNKYPEFEAFNRNFNISEDIINEIVENGEKEGIEKDKESLAFTKENMSREIKAFIARDLYTRNDFYRVYYDDDEVIKVALKVIENQKDYNSKLVSTE